MTRAVPAPMPVPLPHPPLADLLATDRYCLRMAQAHLQAGRTHETTTELFLRKPPAQRGYLIACGLAEALLVLQAGAPGAAKLAWLATQRLPSGRRVYTDDFLAWLAAFRFSGDVEAVPEGTALPAGVPLLRLRGPLPEVTVVETVLLSLLNAQVGSASKAARMVGAAGGLPCWDNGARRAHGPQAGLLTARAAWIAGFAGTSVEDAGLRYGVPIMGTIAHAWVMEFGGPEGEVDAFRCWLEVNPEGSVLLIDTFDVADGARNAMQASRDTGVPLLGVRIDRDPLGPLSCDVREALDAGGFADTLVYASGDLDEHRVTELLAGPGAVDVLAIGTRLAVVEDAPATGAVYKTVERHAADGPRYVAKRHGGKPSIPGAHQAWRGPGGDVLCLAEETWPRGRGMRPLLEPAMRAGRPVGIGEEPLQAARDRCATELAALPASAARLVDPEPLTLTVSDALAQLTAEVRGSVPV